MRTKVAARLNEVVKSLECNIELTAACGSQVATKLLQMARLDLLCEIHGIRDNELQAFADEMMRKRLTRNEAVITLAELTRSRDSRG